MPFGTLGYRVLACVIGYNVALFTTASRNKYQRWGQEWLDIYHLLVPLSLVMFLPDEFQYYQGLIEYNIGPPFIGLGGHVSLVMPAGMWTIALFPFPTDSFRPVCGGVQRTKRGWICGSSNRRHRSLCFSGGFMLEISRHLDDQELSPTGRIMKMAWFSLVLALLTYAAKDVAKTFPTKFLSIFFFFNFRCIC